MASENFISLCWSGSSFELSIPTDSSLLGTEINWGDGNSTTLNSAGVLTHTYADGEDFHNIIINNITSISKNVFKNCIKLKSVIIGNGITLIGNSAFYGCSNLASITISDSVTSIDTEAFRQCSSLTSIVIPKSVTSIGSGAFNGCSGLTSIAIPNSVTVIGWYMCYNCSNLISITIPDSVTSINGYAFYGCSGLTSITIPDSVTSINNSAFQNCTNLSTLILPTGVSIASTAFSNITSLNVYSKAIEKEAWEDNKKYIFSNTTYTIRYYSKTLPESNPEQYWHWNGEGFKISMNDDNMIESPNFIVTQDGTVNAVNAKLSGYIEATGGSIGGFQIQKEQLSSEYLTITPKSIELLDEGGLITIGDSNVMIGVQTINGNTIPAIISENSTFILGNKFYNTSTGSDTKKIDYCGLKFVAGNIPNAIEMNIRIYHMSYKSTSLFGSTFTVSFKYSNDTDIYPQNVTVEMWFRWHATGGGNYSDTKGPYKVTFSANTLYTGKDGSFSFDDVIYLIGVDSFQVAFKNPKYYTDPDWKTIPITENVNNNDVYTDKKYFIGNEGVPPIYCMGNLYPDGNDYTIGAYGAMWLQGWFTEVKYGTNGSNSLSDRTVKTNISDLNNIEQYSLLFDYLDPVKYQFIEGTSGRYHTGFISQDVEQAIEKAGLTTQDFAGFVKDKDDDGNEHYYLRYEEFIALNTDQIQKLKKRIAELEKQIKEIKGEN